MSAKYSAQPQESIFLSVVIPTYNMSEKIGTCLDSIAKQNIKNYEIVIVDDASSDNLERALKPYIEAALPIRAIYLSQNKGVSNARNVGIREARGEYIHFVDADDAVVAKSYHYMIQRARENPCDIIVADYIFTSSVARNEVHYRGRDGLARCLENNNLSLWNKWFKRSFILANNLQLNTTMNTAEDALFCFQAYRKEPSICCVNHLLYQYKYDDMDVARHHERDLHITSCQNSLTVLREAFSAPVPEETKCLWTAAYMNYFSFIYSNIWSRMQDPFVKGQAFTLMQQTLYELGQCNDILHLGYGKNALQFESLVGCDYMTFLSLDYKEYTFLRLLQKHSSMSPGCVPSGNSSSIQQLFLNECRRGHVGMKIILKAIKNWIAFKLGN